MSASIRQAEARDRAEPTHRQRLPIYDILKGEAYGDGTLRVLCALDIAGTVSGIDWAIRLGVVVGPAIKEDGHVYSCMLRGRGSTGTERSHI